MEEKEERREDKGSHRMKRCAGKTNGQTDKQTNKQTNKNNSFQLIPTLAVVKQFPSIHPSTRSLARHPYILT